MYISADDDKSDLFLAGAVYLVGGQILGVLLGRIPLPAGLGPFVGFVITLATTIAVPLWLIRYRKQRLREFGFDSAFAAAGSGLVVSLPVVAAYLISGLIGRATITDVLPVAIAATQGLYVDMFLQVLSGICIVLLTIYMTVKARTGFRADPAYIKPTMLRLARYTAIAAGIATALLLLTALTRGGDLATAVEVVLVPAGVAGAGYLAYRSIRGSQLTSQATLLTPMVVLAIGSFVLFAPAAQFVFGLWRAAILAGIGLVIGALLESRRTAWAPLGFAAGLTLLTPLLL